MKRTKKPVKPPMTGADGATHKNIESSYYCKAIRARIKAHYTVVDLKTKKPSVHTLDYVHEVEPREFRKGLTDPTHTYTILYGMNLFKWKGERYIDDVSWISVGCKGLDYEYERMVTEVTIDNVGHYQFWEVGVPDTEHAFRHIKKCKFHPEEVERFNKDMKSLLAIARRNPHNLI